ncbi:hypothetical protein AO385_1617 [Moraxella catarrhalis]|uniref:Uncharacterized protein n=1 Tax=Moraxella catarrhalis TaxID=480 RepID=A0A198UH06_MORCA|nr:hypothetical protein AO383_2002 [Moraxella catarrhalis]OAU95728.1 hypothetical protein AO384_1334 [Moraxella catarrhalis]OAU98396.1 hypothetical protein AO385_1617 [Moraxella catarrhalis]OAU99099.1 hypothetical protein AO382_2121 [Moraxella catarrhalis]
MAQLADQSVVELTILQLVGGNMTKAKDSLLRFIHMFLMWIGVNFIIFQSLSYWKTLFGAFIFSVIYTAIWQLIFAKKQH